MRVSSSRRSSLLVLVWSIRSDKMPLFEYTAPLIASWNVHQQANPDVSTALQNRHPRVARPDAQVLHNRHAGSPPPACGSSRARSSDKLRGIPVYESLLSAPLPSVIFVYSSNFPVYKADQARRTPRKSRKHTHKLILYQFTGSCRSDPRFLCHTRPTRTAASVMGETLQLWHGGDVFSYPALFVDTILVNLQAGQALVLSQPLRQAHRPLHARSVAAAMYTHTHTHTERASSPVIPPVILDIIPMPRLRL
eukprot:8141575-Pyramimonas_sp.AAC.1